MKNGGTVMNERIFKSFKEYKSAYFPDSAHEPLVQENVSDACDMATRAIEKHAEKLKNRGDRPEQSRSRLDKSKV